MDIIDIKEWINQNYIIFKVIAIFIIVVAFFCSTKSDTKEKIIIYSSTDIQSIISCYFYINNYFFIGLKNFLKKIKIFFKITHNLVFHKRDRYVGGSSLTLKRKGVNYMYLSNEEEETLEYEFEAFCKKLLRNEARDYYRELKYQKKRLISMNELTQEQLNQLSKLDEYEINFYLFHVMGYKVKIKDSAISKAIQQLTKKKRDIILLSFFLGMSDTEIAKKMNLVQSTISRHRVTSLKELKKFMEETKDEEQKKKETESFTSKNYYRSS